MRSSARLCGCLHYGFTLWIQMLGRQDMLWTLIVLSVLLLTCPETFTGNRELTGPAEPVRASVGQDVVLPCSVEPPVDVSTLTVEWSIDTTMVHVYRNTRDDVNLQHEVFRKRTSLFKDDLVNGNVSLKLSSVQKTDGGTYTCHVPQLTDVDVKKVDVQLVVEDNVSNTTDSSSSPDGDATERNSATTQTSALTLLLVLASASLLYM